MSIKIGNTITNPNNFTNKERVSLSSITESNLIIMKSEYSDVNISLFSAQDNNNFTIGKSSDVFKITENSSSVVSLSLACNIFYAPTYINNSLSVSQSINIGSVLTTNELNTKLLKITPSTSISSNYFIASNTNGVLMSANTNGFVNIIGSVNIGNIPYNPNYSLMVNSNVSIGNALTAQTVTCTNLNSANFNTSRITGRNSIIYTNNSYIDFGSVTNQPVQSLQFNTTYSDAGRETECTKFTGNLWVTGTVFADKTKLTNEATFFDNLLVSSNINTSSEIITNNSNVKQTTFEINHTNYNNNYDIFDINLISYRSNIDTGITTQEKVDALTIDSVGRVQVGAVQYTNSIFSVQTTVNNALTTSNLFTLIGNDSNNSIIYINNKGDLGIGTTNPTSRLHINQSYADTSSNTHLVTLYAETFSTSNYDTGSNIYVISDLIAGFSNNIEVFTVNYTGDIIGNSITTSNSVTSYTINTSTINANNITNTINYNNSSISNINTFSTNSISTNFINTSNTITTSNLIARSIFTSNFFIPNLAIFNDMGYYAVYTQQLWFTGSNIVMSSLNSDRIADASQGKLVVRTDDQLIVGNENAVGLNEIGTQRSSIRITSSQQPTYELFGPNTTTYFSATRASSPFGENMLYISHLQNSTQGINISDNPSFSQLRIYAKDSQGNSKGTVLENLVYIKYNNTGNNVGINTDSPTNTLHVRGSLLVNNTDSPSLLYANYTGGSIRVGVGTTNVVSQLDVMGSIYARNSTGGIVGNIYTEGRIGVGLSVNTSPSANLHVVGSGYFTNNIGIATLPSTSYALNINGNTNIVNGLYASNIGIGILNPSFNLDVNGSANFRSNVNIHNLTTTNTIQGNISGSANTVTNPVQPAITTLNTINISSLSVTNSIQGNISGSSYIVMNAYQSNIEYIDKVKSIGTNVPLITIGNQSTNTFIYGNTIIGQNTTTNTSNSVLYVNGVGLFNSNLTVQGRLITYGNFGSISDKTIKTDLIQIDSPLDKIEKLTGYTYTRTDTKDPTRETGLIAQDVNEVLPEVVYKNTDLDNLLTISYGNMAGLWVEAFKEMRAEINTLKKRIAELEQR